VAFAAAGGRDRGQRWPRRPGPSPVALDGAALALPTVQRLGESEDVLRPVKRRSARPGAQPASTGIRPWNSGCPTTSSVDRTPKTVCEAVARQPSRR